MIVLQRFEQRRLVDDAAAGHVDHDRSRGNARELATPDHSGGLIGERRVKRDDCGLLEEGVERLRLLHSQRLESRLGDVRIVSENFHPECTGARGNFAADSSQPDDSKRASLELRAEQGRPVPSARMHRAVGPGDMAKERNDRAEEELDDGDRIAGRGVDHRDAERGCRVQCDVVDAYSGPANHLELRRVLQELFRDPRCAAPDDGIVVANAAKEVFLRKRGNFVDLESGIRGQYGYAFRIDFICHEHAILHFVSSIQFRHTFSSAPIITWFPLRTSGSWRRSGSSDSFVSHCVSDICAYRRPSSANRFASLSSSAITPNFCANRRSSPSDAGFSIRSTKCVRTRLSEKNRNAFRVSALFLMPNICTSRTSSPFDGA
jgi:hypothetical protein